VNLPEINNPKHGQKQTKLTEGRTTTLIIILPCVSKNTPLHITIRPYYIKGSKNHKNKKMQKVRKVIKSEKGENVKSVKMKKVIKWKSSKCVNHEKGSKKGGYVT